MDKLDVKSMDITQEKNKQNKRTVSECVNKSHKRRQNTACVFKQDRYH